MCQQPFPPVFHPGKQYDQPEGSNPDFTPQQAMPKEETADDPEWRRFHRAKWDELVAVHLRATAYELTALRTGQGRLHPIEETELGPVQGLRILHLQCHFGRDSLILAQQGAEVVGLDFSKSAIAAAHELALEFGTLGASAFHRSRRLRCFSRFA